MKIGIIGAGFVGQSLGKALLKAGHTVMFSSRDPQSEHAQHVKHETGAEVGSVEAVLSYSEIIALAMMPDAVLEVAREYADQLSHKIIIDVNNRLPLTNQSFAQELAQITGGKVVKAFNTIGAEHYLDPVFDGQAVNMFIAGDDLTARQKVGRLASDLGFEVIDAGELDAVPLLESLGALWVHMMRSGAGRDFAFKLLRR